MGVIEYLHGVSKTAYPLTSNYVDPKTSVAPNSAMPATTDGGMNTILIIGVAAVAAIGLAVIFSRKPNQTP